MVKQLFTDNYYLNLLRNTRKCKIMLWLMISFQN